MLRNPSHYGVPLDAVCSAESFGAYVRAQIREHVAALAVARLISRDPETDRLRPEEPGRVMSYFYVCFASIRLATLYEGPPDMYRCLQLLSMADEFSGMTLRRTEKKDLNELNKAGGLRYVSGTW